MFRRGRTAVAWHDCDALRLRMLLNTLAVLPATGVEPADSAVTMNAAQLRNRTPVQLPCGGGADRPYGPAMAPASNPRTSTIRCTSSRPLPSPTFASLASRT